MILGSPVQGTIRPDARYYPKAENATLRPAGSHIPLLVHDFGPSTEPLEPQVIWPGGEHDVYGNLIPAGTYPHFHRGIDISMGGTGFPITAGAAGTVTASGLVAGWGGAIIVLLNHGRDAQGHLWETVYIHLQSESVSNGQRVSAGQQIGKLGNSGISSGAHVHFGIRKDGKYVNGWERLSQNTSVDPDAPVQEADVPTPSTYIPGFVAAVGASTQNVNVRDGASTSARLIRQIPKATTETWTVTCWEQGETVAGSNQWLARWNGAWEYVHASTVLSGPNPPTVDCAPLVQKAHDAGYAEAKENAGKAVAGI